MKKLVRTAKVAASILLCAALPTAYAESLPGPTDPPRRGVQVHRFDWTDKALDVVASGGFDFVRTGFYWYETEKTKERYDWSLYDELVAKLKARRLRAHFTLHGANRLYDSKAMPDDPAQIAAFARWAAAAAAHFRDEPVVWEIWNEPNLASQGAIARDPSRYARFATPTCRAIRAAYPKATVLGGALSTNPASAALWVRYARTLAAGDLTNCVSAYTVHPYSDLPPETVASTYALMRREVPRLTPLLNGEWGYSTTGSRAINDTTQADYAARSFLASEASGVNYNLWFTLRDYDGHRKQRERGFGLVRGDYSRKPAIVAMSTLNRELAGFRFDHDCGPLGGDLHALIYASRAGDRLLVFWTTGGSARFELPADMVKDAVVASDGAIQPHEEQNGRAVFLPATSPSYVALRHGPSPCKTLRLT